MNGAGMSDAGSQGVGQGSQGSQDGTRSAAEVLRDAEGRGLQLSVLGASLRFEGPVGALTPELRAELRAHKADIVRLLAEWAGSGADGTTPAQPASPTGIGPHKPAQPGSQSPAAPVQTAPHSSQLPPSALPATTPVSLTAPTTPAALEALWRDHSAFWESAMLQHADELTDADRDRIAGIEQRIFAALDAGDGPAVLALIGEWQVATTPLRWLPHGQWYRDGATYREQQRVYREEAAVRGVGEAGLCFFEVAGAAGRVNCGGACTGRA